MSHPLTDATLDLLLGSSCLGCGRPGRMLCDRCRATLPDRGRLSFPTPAPSGLCPPWAVGEYEGLLKAMVLGLKEHRLLGLADPLGELLARAAATAIAELGPSGPVVLVPVPSRPASVRARALDPTWVVTRRAARLLAADGGPVLAARLLRTRPGVMDQAGLDARRRAANLAGSMTCPTPWLARLARRTPQASVVLCDDVITTGATAREAQRALEAVGLEVAGVAAIAATRKRV